MLSIITAVLGVIPVIGTVVSSFLNMKTQMAQINATENVQEAQVSAQIIQETMGDIFVRVCRDIILFGGTVWFSLVTWDTIVAKHWPNFMWHTANYPPSVAYLPYAILVFLLGNIGLNMWNKK